MCGFDGRLGRNPVAIEAAHVRWHSQDGPDELGVLGLSPGLRVTVSPLYVATSQVGRAIDTLAGQPLHNVRPGQPPVDVIHINRHTIPGLQKPGPPGRMNTDPTPRHP
jgi:putative restriction endonuclease